MTYKVELSKVFESEMKKVIADYGRLKSGDTSYRFGRDLTEGEQSSYSRAIMSAIAIKDKVGNRWRISPPKADEIWNRPDLSPSDMRKYISPILEQDKNRYLPIPTTSSLEYMRPYGVLMTHSSPRLTPQWGRHVPKAPKRHLDRGKKDLREAYFDWKSMEELRRHTILVEKYMRGEPLEELDTPGIQDTFLKVFQHQPSMLSNNHWR